MKPITLLDKQNTPIGPFTREQVAAKLQSGEISLDDFAFIEGLAQWTPLRDVLAQVNATPAPISQPAAVAPVYSYAATMQPPPGVEFAGFWVRVAAHILDNLIISVPFIIVYLFIFGALIGFGSFTALAHAQQHGNQPDPTAVASIIGAVIFFYLSLIFGRLIVVWLYHAILESGPHQSTWGKRILGLKVTNISGMRISFGHATGRYFSTIITNMTMGIGYLMVAFTDRKQTLHDLIAGTLVVRR